jgi:hypothetical protein
VICSGKRIFSGLVCIAIAVAMAGCSSESTTVVLPDEGPEVVAKQFYEYISEAKLRGGPTPAKAAFKLIDSEKAHLDVHRFLSIIKSYPPGFMVSVDGFKINGTQAVVDITYKMPSAFGDSYDVKGKLPLNLDRAANKWVVDFTGDTYGLQKKDFLAGMPEAAK